MKDLDKSELVEQALEFWFKNQNHIRTPFPNYIHNKLKQQAIDKFDKWLEALKDEFKDDVNDEIIAEKFEEILFEEAHKLVITEDERISILYPFLPRIGDHISDYEEKKSKITDRNIITKNDKAFLEVKCKRLVDDKIWNTSFELPI